MMIVLYNFNSYTNNSLDSQWKNDDELNVYCSLMFYCVDKYSKKILLYPTKILRNYWFPKIIGIPESPEPITMTLLLLDSAS